MSERPSPDHLASGHICLFEKFLLNAEEAALLMSVHRSTIYDLLNRGDLPSVKIGRRRLIPLDAIKVFIASNEQRGLA